MKNVLLVVATEKEIEKIISHFVFISANGNLKKYSYKKISIDVLTTSIGMVATAYELGKTNVTGYDLVLNIGICGAINKHLQLGEIVNITSDYIYELGAEDGDDFLKFEELNLPGKNKFGNNSSVTIRTISELKKVSGITVNTVHGNEASIQKIGTRIQADVESMEGAAFMFAMEKSIIPYFQLRAISNYVEKRDKSKWNISLALDNLSKTVNSLIDSD